MGNRFSFLTMLDSPHPAEIQKAVRRLKEILSAGTVFQHGQVPWDDVMQRLGRSLQRWAWKDETLMEDIVTILQLVVASMRPEEMVRGRKEFLDFVPSFLLPFLFQYHSKVLVSRTQALFGAMLRDEWVQDGPSDWKTHLGLSRDIQNALRGRTPFDIGPVLSAQDRWMSDRGRLLVVCRILLSESAAEDCRSGIDAPILTFVRDSLTSHRDESRMSETEFALFEDALLAQMQCLLRSTDGGADAKVRQWGSALTQVVQLILPRSERVVEWVTHLCAALQRGLVTESARLLDLISTAFLRDSGAAAADACGPIVDTIRCCSFAAEALQFPHFVQFASAAPHGTAAGPSASISYGRTDPALMAMQFRGLTLWCRLFVPQTRRRAGAAATRHAVPGCR